MEKTYDIKMGLWEIIGSFRMEFGKEPLYITINDYTYYNRGFTKFRVDNEKAFKDVIYC